MARYRPGLQNQRKILDATRELLGEHGLDNVTLRAICQRAGLSTGSFYNLFPSRDAAVLGVVREALEAIDPSPDDDQDTSLDQLVDAYVRFLEEDTAMARVYLQVGIGAGVTDPAIGARFLRHHEGRLERFTRAIRKEHPDLEPEWARQRAETILAALNGFAFQKVLNPSFDFAGHARRLISAQVR